MSLLEIESLRIEFPGEEDERLVAVKGVDLAVEQGETVGLVGESGSGKSLTCRAVMRMVPEPGAITAGQVRFDGEDVLSLGTKKLRDLRAHSVGMIYQNPFGSLNPTMRIGAQIAETLKVNKGMKRDAANKEAVALLDRVGIEDPEHRARAYPHELSGGMCQRVMIAISTASSPRLMLADEPTTALDVTTQAQILKLLAKMRAEEGMAMLLVSHDFGVIAQACDRVAVMYGGHIVETGPVETIYHEPEHPYTRALLNSVPELDSAGNVQRRAALAGHPPELSEVIPGCVFAPRCEHAKQDCATVAMRLEPVGPDHASACPVRPFADAGARSTGEKDAAHLLEVESLVKEFGVRRGLAERIARTQIDPHRAVDDVSFTLDKGEILGIAGGSGSGKTTLARCLIRLIEPDGGAVRVDGIDIRAHKGAELRELRRRMQMVFQDPYASLNPRLTIGAALHEAGKVHNRPGAENESAFVSRLLAQVQLTDRIASRKPRELSGGQRQRVSIARALAVDPEVIIADEAVSALDVSVQAQLLNLFLDLREELGVAILFISHQLAVIAEVADRIAVMQKGRIVETGPTSEVFAHPKDEYTQALLRAHPHPDPRMRFAAS